MPKNESNVIPAVILMVVFGALMRLVPHPANVAPVAALALFGGAYLPLRYALTIPLLTMVASDLVIGFDAASLPYVYGIFLLTALLGHWLGRPPRLGRTLGASLVSSVGFFLVTNLVWLYPVSMYPHSFAGQIASYTMALPFFRNTVLGDFSYTFLFFGGYAVIEELARLHLPARMMNWAFGTRVTAI